MDYPASGGSQACFLVARTSSTPPLLSLAPKTVEHTADSTNAEMLGEMRLRIVEYERVNADFDSGAPNEFNSNFHTAEEAPDLPIPSNAPTSFERWLPLVMRSRGLQDGALQVVSLTSVQVRLLVLAAGASVHTRVLNRAYAEDLEEQVAPAFGSLVFPTQGLFMRLAACSTKDGAQKAPGNMSISSVDDIILQLTTSLRAWSALNNAVNSRAPCLSIFFLPFDPRMDTAQEYRVFCAPETMKITAVSQYRWHKPWRFAGRSEEERIAIARSIFAGIQNTHAAIVRDVRAGNAMDDLLRQQGFTFDVLFDESRSSCELIELNTFGVRSACGSCLFHWVEHRDLLYGERSEKVDFAVTM
ncbi:hypothetical protein QBC35DRAFT_503850 [Podospora australis]|uniref:Cell division cycle protein 123 n=1 Tax=Podospora australis TaxID=1536484 RepID=A0AAN7AGT4_9PEZI|nr:hypothetical protein QBC35DRAFT_503850 [Podospora australis]